MVCSFLVSGKKVTCFWYITIPNYFILYFILREKWLFFYDFNDKKKVFYLSSSSVGVLDVDVSLFSDEQPIWSSDIESMISRKQKEIMKICHSILTYHQPYPID